MGAAVSAAAVVALVASTELAGASTGAMPPMTDQAFATETSKVCAAKNAVDATFEEEGASGDEACALQHALRRTSRDEAIVSDADGSDAAAGTSTRRQASESQRSWSKRRAAEADLEHELIFDVETRSMDELHNMLVDRSTPDSPRFRQWLSREEALGADRNRASLDATRKVLEEAGATSFVEVGGTFLKARAPVATWQKLLDAELFIYGRSPDNREEAGGGDERIRAESYVLPACLASHVAGVLKLLHVDDSPNSHTGLEPMAPSSAADGDAAASSQSDPASSSSSSESLVEKQQPKGPGLQSQMYSPTACSSPPCKTFDGLRTLMGGQVVTPEALRAAYNVPPVAASGSVEARYQGEIRQLIVARGEVFFSPEDMNSFQRQFNLPQRAVQDLSPGGTRANDSICKTKPELCQKAHLNLQYMNAMSPWSTLLFYHVGAKTEFDDLIVELLALDPMPHVINICEGLPERAMSTDSMKAFDRAMIKSGIMGATVIANAGYNGAAGWTNDYECKWTKHYGHQVLFPASSEYVTAVGGTMGVEIGRPEVALSVKGTSETFRAGMKTPFVTTGGGFSRTTALPFWQRDKAWAGSISRGVPDLALAGHSVVYAVGGLWSWSDSPDAGAATFAGMISLINAQRKEWASTKMGGGNVDPDEVGRLGFLNSKLYWKHMDGAFKDITEGDNKCALKNRKCCNGWTASTGWDPVSGLGSPDFKRLSEHLLDILAIWPAKP